MTSDAPDACARIARFAAGSGAWLVSVLMISGGVDIHDCAWRVRDDRADRAVLPPGGQRFIRRTPSPRAPDVAPVPGQRSGAEAARGADRGGRDPRSSRSRRAGRSSAATGEAADLPALSSSARRDDDVMTTTAPGDPLSSSPSRPRAFPRARRVRRRITRPRPHAPAPARPALRRDRVRAARAAARGAPQPGRRDRPPHGGGAGRVERAHDPRRGAPSAAKSTVEQLERANPPARARGRPRLRWGRAPHLRGVDARAGVAESAAYVHPPPHHSQGRRDGRPARRLHVDARQLGRARRHRGGLSLLVRGSRGAGRSAEEGQAPRQASRSSAMPRSTAPSSSSATPRSPTRVSSAASVPTERHGAGTAPASGMGSRSAAPSSSASTTTSTSTARRTGPGTASPATAGPAGRSDGDEHQARGLRWRPRASVVPMEALPDWPEGTVAVLHHPPGPHAIPVSLALRAGPRELVIGLAPRRPLARAPARGPALRGHPSSPSGHVDFTAHGRAVAFQRARTPWVVGHGRDRRDRRPRPPDLAIDAGVGLATGPTRPRSSVTPPPGPRSRGSRPGLSRRRSSCCARRLGGGQRVLRAGEEQLGRLLAVPARHARGRGLPARGRPRTRSSTSQASPRPQPGRHRELVPSTRARKSTSRSSFASTSPTP